MENDNKIVLLAEEVTIDKQRSNDIFLLIRFKLFDNKGNRNKEGVTASFICEISNHREKYAALPLYVDVKKLLDRDYANLGHNYDAESGTFNTEQIGGLVDFVMSLDNQGVVSLYAEARVPKREAEICERLMELYELGVLCVSFEVRYNPANVVQKDGVRFVDAGEGNALTGMAIVSVPAYPDAIAMDMVAETIESNEVKTIMPDEEKVTQVQAGESTQTEAEAVAQPEAGTETASVPAGDDVENAEAEVVREGVGVHEAYSICPETGKTIHEVYTTHEVVETVESESDPSVGEQAMADQDLRDAKIAELEAALAQATEQLAQFKDAQAAAELKIRQNEIQSFAESQGLDQDDQSVAEAVAQVNYEAIAKLAMAKTSEKKSSASDMSVAGFVTMEISHGEYGGLLERSTK